MVLAIPFFSLLTNADGLMVQNRIGQVYVLEKSGRAEATPSFTQKLRIEVLGTLETRISTIEDKDGNVVMTETAILRDGHMSEHTVEQLQIEERFELRVKDDKVTFKTSKILAPTSSGKREIKLISETSQDLPTVFLTGPGTEAFIKQESETIMKGESVRASFGVFEVERTVDFVFVKDLKSSTAEVLALKMSPKSLWLSLLVDTIELRFDPKSFQLLSFQGRMPLRKKVGKDWKPLDAVVFYENVASPAGGNK